MDQTSKRKLSRRLIGTVLLLALCGWAALVFGVNRAMHEPPEQFGQFMSKMPVAIFLMAPFETMWTRARSGTLQVGDPAPDFTLQTLDKSAQINLAAVRKDHPVVLVFGSYT